ncbi:MAG: hypothetical protein SNG10_00180 [Rikenellaceae bacterium]
MRVIKIYNLVALLFVAIAFNMGVQNLYAQNELRVNGVVKSAHSKAPIRDVGITVDGVFKCYSDVDGRFSLIISRDAELYFQHQDYDDNKVKLKGQQEISVQLQERVVEIEEVVISSTIRRKQIGVEQTEIDVRGNYLHIDTKYYVPTYLFKTDFRFIAQPVIVDKTLGETRILRPVVINGDKYELIQNRWLHFGESVDSLSPYVVENHITPQNNVYAYRDSVLISERDPKLQNDYYSDCYLALVTYHEPPVFVDTVTIARGLVDPARHFEYNIEPMQLNNTLLESGVEPYLIPTGLDTIYIPTYELKLQQVSGVAKIEFEVNSSIINYDNEATRSKIEEIRGFLDMLQRNPDATIKSISLCGYASPEGMFSKNKVLAQSRTDEMLRLIVTTLNPSLLKYIELNTDSYVEPWSRVADLLEEEHAELSAKLRKIIVENNGQYNTINNIVVKMPEYRSVMLPYLEQLRTVTYKIEYSVYKPLPYEVIREKYGRKEELTRYEYYVLISHETDASIIPQMEKDAIAAFPDFTIFVNRAAINLIREDSVDLDLLQPSLRYKNPPMPIIYNQATMAIKCDSVFVADSLVTKIETYPEAEHLVNVLRVLKGDFSGAYPYYQDTHSINEVILLLAMDRNAEAKSLMDQLMLTPENQNNAKYCYIYAVCGNRLDDLNTAIIFLQQAMLLDPDYEESVQRDADLLDIYELLNQQQQNSNE